MSIAWSPDLAIGVPEIDVQHQEIFVRVAALVAAVDGGKSTEELAGTLAFLVSYVQEHFGSEEGLMLVYAYPLATDHRDQHRAFMRTVGMLRHRFELEGPSKGLREELETFLAGWLRDHIGGSDRALGRWLVQRIGEVAVG